MEKHSSFWWPCIYCEYITARENGKHSRCSRGERPLSYICHNRISEETGENARQSYEGFRRTEAQEKVVEVKPPVDNQRQRSPHKKSYSERRYYSSCARSKSRSPKRHCTEARKYASEV